MEFKIREIREKCNITQTELAIKSGVSRTTINQLENGRKKAMTTFTLLKIATALGTTVDELFCKFKD